MKPLAAEYQQVLNEIKAQIPESEELKKYLEDEEEEDYQALRDRFEPMVKALYVKVAKNNPLQLIDLENQLLDPTFEGIFLSRILGYTVLRGHIKDDYKYTQPQEHFKDVLMAICNSSNFEYLRKRIGQTIQMGFALSSDIWVTNLINDVVIKQVRYFLQTQKLPKYHDIRERRIGYHRYANQFKSDYFRSAAFPSSLNEMKFLFPALREFIEYRISAKLNNKSLIEPIMTLLRNEAFKGSTEHTIILGLFAGFYDLDESTRQEVANILNDLRRNYQKINEQWLVFILQIHENKNIHWDKNSELNIAALIDKSIHDDISDYYSLMEVVHTKGYIHDDAIEAIRVFYANHEGMSVVNQCVRKTILGYIKQFMNGLSEEEYTSYFELSKIFPTYIGIFSNQQFNQSLKEICMAYVKKLIKRFTDKRGKDYQDVKKFVNNNFVELGFMNQKQLTEFFKTPRKKRKKTTA